MNRRKFFKFLPVAPVGAVIATAAAAKAPCESLAPEKALMTLNAYKPPPPPPPAPKYPTLGSRFISTGNSLTNSYITANDPSFNKVIFGKGLEIKADQNFDAEIQVSMAVGKDGHLWLKIGDNWKRVVTE